MTKTFEQIIKEVNPNEWYKPKTISDNQWLWGFHGKNSYNAVLDLIGLRKIMARDFGRGKTKYWKVLGSELIRYLESLK